MNNRRFSVCAGAAAFVLAAPDYSKAQELRDAVASCAAESGQLARLACYDRASEEAGLIVSTATTSTSGNKWTVQESTNPIDDSRRVVLINTADEGRSSFGRPINLVIRCQSNSTDLYINWDDYLGREANVLSRVGSQEARRQRWSMSTDNEATFYPRNVTQFVSELMQVDTFVAQVTPYNESPVTAIWDVSGLSEAIAPLREACNW